MTNALELIAVEKTYHQGGEPVSVLRGVDLAVQAGEIVSLVGPSGCGKSTLLHVAGLLDAPDSGEVVVDNHSTGMLSDTARTAMRRDKLGFIYQSHHLLPEFSALENVMMPLVIAGVKKASAQAQAVELLESLGLADRANHRPGQLSGGQQQRVAIARAFVHKPALVLADEPTGNLDPDTAADVFHLFKEHAAARNTAVLMVTHNAELAAKTDRVLTLEHGQITS